MGTPKSNFLLEVHHIHMIHRIVVTLRKLSELTFSTYTCMMSLGPLYLIITTPLFGEVKGTPLFGEVKGTLLYILLY